MMNQQREDKATGGSACSRYLCFATCARCYIFCVRLEHFVWWLNVCVAHYQATRKIWLRVGDFLIIDQSSCINFWNLICFDFE